MDEIITVDGLNKSYNGHPALRDVSFTVRPGEVIGLLGPNGAGKTTLMKILTGYLHADQGQVLIHGIDVTAEPERAQARIGYLPENAPLYPELSVQSHLRMTADLRGIPEADQPRLIGAAVKALGLEERLTRPVASLSKGYRQRVGLAQALVHRPALLVLDEPTNGLDPTQIGRIRALIRDLARESTVLVSTHILSEVEAVCDRVIIIMDGQVRADARLDELATPTRVRAVFTEAVDARAALESLDGATRVMPDNAGQQGAAYLLESPDPQALCPRVFGLAVERGWTLAELNPEGRTLEAVFNELAAGGSPS